MDNESVLKLDGNSGAGPKAPSVGDEVPETAAEPAVAFGSAAYRAMIAKSLLSKGNNKRLKAAIEKAERGGDVTIAYIGGSITQGASLIHIINFA